MLPRRVLLRCALLSTCAFSLAMCATVHPSRQQCEDGFMRATELVVDSQNDLAMIRKHLRNRTPGSPEDIAISSCRQNLTKQDIHCLLTYETLADFTTCLSSPGATK